MSKCSLGEIARMCDLWIAGSNATEIARECSRHVSVVTAWLNAHFEKELVDQPNGPGYLRRTRRRIVEGYREPSLNYGERVIADGRSYSEKYIKRWTVFRGWRELGCPGEGEVRRSLERAHAWRALGFFTSIFEHWPMTEWGWRKGTRFWSDSELYSGNPEQLMCYWPAADLLASLSENGVGMTEAIPLLQELEALGALWVVQHGSNIVALELPEGGPSPSGASAAASPAASGGSL